MKPSMKDKHTLHVIAIVEVLIRVIQGRKII
jgi:hypothetical protein